MSAKAAKKRLLRVVKSLIAKCDKAGTRDYAKYRDDPVGFARDVLNVTLTKQQIMIAKAVAKCQRVLVDSGHNVGKTFLAAVLVVWWYYCKNPSVVITTAPTLRDVVKLLWTEIRILVRRGNLPRHLSPSAAEMSDPSDKEEHWAMGFTARRGESFQGRHRKCMFFVFDEAEGVDSQYWQTLSTMYKPDCDHAVLAIGNPTTTSSQAYLEGQATYPDGTPKWNLFNLSALDHPNIIAELKGEKPPIDGAVSLSQVETWISDWCLPVTPETKLPTDFEWHPGSGRWWRPGPIAEPRILGRRPSAGTYNVWSDYLWGLIEKAKLRPTVGQLPEIGCDVARFGDDFTEIHIRRGGVSIHHEWANGWGTDETAGRLKLLAREVAADYNKTLDVNEPQIRPEQIKIKVDDDGVGGGVYDQRGEFNFIAVSAASKANNPNDYPNKRSELWFSTAYRAKVGLLSIAKLPREVQQRLRRQALAPEYKLDAAGRRVVEPKADTKERLAGRSPDAMDAFNLAYYEAPVIEQPTGHRSQKRDIKPGRVSAAAKRGLWGKKQ